MTRARDNPFAADRVLAYRYEPQGWTWDELMGRLRDMRYRGAIVGPHGSGKTTLVEDLRSRLDEAGLPTIYVQLWADKRRLSRGDWSRLAAARTSRPIVLLDGAEQLSPLRWLQLLLRVRKCRGLIVTVHRPGRLPTLVETTTSPDLLRRIATSLDPGQDLGDAEDLHARYAGNLRDALRELYDRRAADTGEKGIGPRMDTNERE
jgi:GTPase SAR1 family protein